ncbi:hypothetical protein SELMODRAFT_407912 [Selaginella moellendorffii]|uniref:Aerobactin siderophore biosynthesis IucA/IucC N-terminal domain-containing protein n=1 Tax=Selaginella moellendorffii TaxID=88036 RepID=D8R561_SELML|nr:hypothetical protein SELMODRAFT_407912 [Selaginella moellendorffii]
MEVSKFQTEAKNAVLARLLACLVNEKFVKAYLVLHAESLPARLAAPVPPKHRKHWMCISAASEAFELLKHGSFLVPLRELPPVQKPPQLGGEPAEILPVTLLDPDEIGFPVQQLQVDRPVEYVPADVRTVTTQLQEWNPALSAALVEQITQEMENSVSHQAAAYSHHQGRAPPELEHTTDSTQWEQLIVEGHATHPMHKSRFHVPPTLPIDPWNNDLSAPKIHFFAVPRSKLTVRGDFEKLVAPLVQISSTRANVFMDSCDELVMPVHHVQVPSVLLHFPHARHLPFTCKARAQASVRTVVVDELPAFNLKLPIGVKISSATRTITPWTTHIGPAFKPVADKIIEDNDLLEVAHELASVVSNHPDPDVAKNLSCVIRQDPQHLATTRARGERVVLSAALTERYPSRSDDFVVNTLFHLDSLEKKELFFQNYARLFLRAFLPPLLKHGVSFEAHLQNVLARFRPAAVAGEWELVGFTVRDLGGIKAHQQTLFETTGLELDVWDAENCSQLAETIDEVHNLAFHTIIQCHLHRLARALSVHYNAKGWEFVRAEVDAMLPPGCHARSLWLGATVNWKAFITMKLQGLYRDYLYIKVPNLITYRPS